MGALRQARSFNADGANNQSPAGFSPTMNQSVPTLIVMIVVLFIIMAFCFWGAPAVRAFCRKRVCCCCPMDEPRMENEFSESESATPTVILLPYGRMLVVDRNIFAQIRSTHTGIDFMEITTNLIRAQRIPGALNRNSRVSWNSDNIINKQPSSEFLPPAYEDIYHRSSCELPPSYSQISIVNDKLCTGPNSAPSIIRHFTSVPSIPKELKSNKLLLSKKKYCSSSTINTNSERQDSISELPNTRSCQNQDVQESTV